MSLALHLNGATIMTTPTGRHLRIAREAGFAGVEVRAERLLGAPEELADAASIARPGEVWSLNGIQLQVDPGGRLRRDLLDEEMPPRLDICRALGAAYLLVVPPRIKGLAPEAALAGISQGLELAAERAGRVGVRVAFEFLGFGDCPINTPDLAAQVAEDVPASELVLDSCHWHAAGGPTLDGFPVDRVAMVHLNDAPRKPPREIEDADRVLPTLGVIRLIDLVSDLRARGYRGPWSLETFSPAYWERDPAEVAGEGFRLTTELLRTAIP
jgi:sugar phosphate isomerase/epimerase